MKGKRTRNTLPAHSKAIKQVLQQSQVELGLEEKEEKTEKEEEEG